MSQEAATPIAAPELSSWTVLNRALSTATERRVLALLIEEMSNGRRESYVTRLITRLLQLRQTRHTDFLHRVYAETIGDKRERVHRRVVEVLRDEGITL